MTKVFIKNMGTKDGDDSEWIQTSLPKAELNTRPIYKKEQGSILIIIATIVLLTIMVLTKLWPCIETSWEPEFCNRWNDFWFGLSASLVAAILFYVFSSRLPEKKMRKTTMPTIRREIAWPVVHFNLMLAVSIKKECSLDILKESFVNGLLDVEDWSKQVSYFEGSKQKTFFDCLITEIKYAKKHLEALLNRYNDYLNIEEKLIISEDILHHRIFTTIELQGESAETDEFAKKQLAGLIYDFYWKLIDFSVRFKTNEDENPYNW
jgi:hypothetical protein